MGNEWATKTKDTQPNKVIEFLDNPIMTGINERAYYDYTVRVLSPISKYKYDKIKEAIETVVNDDIDWDKVSGQIYEYVKNGGMLVSDLSWYLKHHFVMLDKK